MLVQQTDNSKFSPGMLLVGHEDYVEKTTISDPTNVGIPFAVNLYYNALNVDADLPGDEFANILLSLSPERTINEAYAER